MTAALSRPRAIAYAASTTVAAVGFIVPGFGNLLRVPAIATDMAHLGYPVYFLAILGTGKLLGAIAIAVPGLPRLKEWAYAGMIFDLTGAAISRAVSGDGAVMTLVPLGLAGVVLTSWATRPANRRLASLTIGVSHAPVGV